MDGHMVSPVTTGITQISEPGTATLSSRLGSISGRYIRFGPFQIDQKKEQLTRDGSRIRVSGKKYRLLLALVEKPGEVVTRDNICQYLWPIDNDVNRECNLTATINNLRRALGDSSRNPLYIETIPRKGYVFIAHPEVSNHPNGSHLNLPVEQTSRATAKSLFFSIRRMIGLILIGMVFGAGMMAFWISYHR